MEMVLKMAMEERVEALEVRMVQKPEALMEDSTQVAMQVVAMRADEPSGRMKSKDQDCWNGDSYGMRMWRTKSVFRNF